VTNGVREFRPNASLSRAEFVTMLVRTLKLDTSSEDVSVFKDAKDIAAGRRDISRLHMTRESSPL
jgi:hypothetical protein